MKLKKIVFISIVLLFMSLSVVYSSDCYFNVYNESCNRIYNTNTNFRLTDLSSNQDFDRYEIKIYNKNNPANEVNFNLSEFDINLLNGFLKSGVYVIDVKAYMKNNLYTRKKFEYIYDNNDLKPPILEVNLEVNSGVLETTGYGLPNSELVVKYNSKEEVFDINEKGNVNISINNLDQGVNILNFYIRNSQRESEKVKRIVINENLNEQYLQDISSIEIDNLELINENTISGYTTSRNFLVTGTVSSFNDVGGQIVFVNGQKVLADSNGNFAGIVLLNDGLNEIVVQSGNQKVTYNINYIDLVYRIKNVRYDKVVLQDRVNIQGDVSFDYSFNVFVNGNYYDEVMPVNNEFSFDISNLKKGRNFIELRGIDNSKVELIVYYDTKVPETELISQSKIINDSDVVFEIRDDIGINLNSIKLNIDNQIFDEEFLKIDSNIYSFDVSNLNEGNYNYVLSGEDLAGRSFTDSGSININQNNTLISDIILDGSVLGNRIFLKEGNVELKLIPTKNIAFKSIYLDGIEQVDYEIYNNDVVKLNLNISKTRGELKLNFINKDYEEFSQVFYYKSDNVDPSLKIDYIKNPYSLNKVRITGEIVDANFDWSSLKINRQDSFMRYGDYFEALIDLNNSGLKNLEISGYDLAMNSFTKNYDDILFNDNTDTYLKSDIGQVFVNSSFKGNLYDDDETRGNYNYINKYDGFRFNRLYLSSDGFELPVQDIYGKRSVMLEGFEDSENLNHFYDSFIVKSEINDTQINYDNQVEVFFYNLRSRTRDDSTVIQGFVNEKEIDDINVNNGICDLYENSFSCIVNLQDGGNLFDVSLNVNGEIINEEVSIEKISNNLALRINEVSGDVINHNSKYYLLDDNVNIEGFVNNVSDIEVLVDGHSIYTGEKTGSFREFYNLSFITNTVDEKDVNIQLKAVDENGFEVFSNKFKILYQRIFETFSKVVIE